jgi:hypothetical protein
LTKNPGAKLGPEALTHELKKSAAVRKASVLKEEKVAEFLFNERQ